MPLKRPDELPKIPKTRKKKMEAAIEAIPDIVSPLTKDGLISLDVTTLIIDKSNKNDPNTTTRLEILYI